MNTTYIIIAFGVLSKAALFIIWKRLPEQKREDISDKVRRALGFFDSNGLRYSHEHLAKIADKIPFWDISKQAQYRDRTCELSVLREMEHLGFMDIHSRPHFPTFNATSVGNLAFVALYSLNKKYRTYALKTLTEYRIWLQR